MTRKEEEAWCHRMIVNFTVSNEDKAVLLEIAPAARVVVLPNGVDTELFQPAAGKKAGLVFVGGHDWFPNRDAMSFFASEILPAVRAHAGDVGVTWVGRAPEQVREEYKLRHNVLLTGYVEDVRPYVGSADCFVVPLRVGGGTRLKILDAWAMGKAVVSTSVGCEGLEARDGENILIRD